MQFTQKKFLFHTASFVFGERALNFKATDERNTFGFNISYEHITASRSVQTVREIWLELFGYMGLFFAILDGTFIGPRGTLAPWPVLVFGAISAVAAFIGRFYFKTEATLISTSLGSIVVLSDDHHDQIVAEIFKRRRDAMRGLLGQVNPLNYPQDEVARFRWLRDENIISLEEFNTAYAAITDAPYEVLR